MKETTLNELVKESHERAVRKGWWEGDVHNVPEKLALIHSEVSEALECYRDGEPVFFTGENGKPLGLGIELADVVIRVADLCGHLGIDLDYCVRVKSEFNERRPYRHGGKKA